ncbi:bacteriohemerythrin [Pseudomonas sp. Pseusp97]|uniref:bacteriohemerythrin n=1 Tax=Pseudomonas sp. Pseusp97 TaxID=3243065 RepID=UPI0039A66EF3
MSFMPWNDDFVIGIERIDQQHRWLVDLTNALYDNLDGAEGTGQPIGELLEQLVEYTMNHFIVEEVLFQRLGYPGEEAHRAEHDRFNRQIIDLLYRHEDGEAVSLEALELLKDWLTHHILKVDKAYVGFFQQKGVTA